MALEKTIKVKASNLYVGDIILDKAGVQVRITGIADSPKGKLLLKLNNMWSISLDADEMVYKVVEED